MNDIGRTKIPYCTETWEITGGCTECSPGCRECYARGLIWRLAHNPVCGDKYKGLVEKVNGKLRWTGKIKLWPEHLEQALKRKAPTTYFVNSRSDLFHPDVPFDIFWPAKILTKAFAIMLLSQQHKFLLLTKRIDRALKIFSEICPDGRPVIRQKISSYLWEKNQYRIVPTKEGLNELQVKTLTEFDEGILWPLPNVYLGATICNQQEADEKIPTLLQIPAAKRWLSIEPMLGPMDIKKYVWLRQKCIGHKGCGFTGASYEFSNAKKEGAYKCPQCGKNHSYLITDSIDWVVIGCESGPNRRPCKIEWMIDLVNQCKAAGVRVYVKQVSINGIASKKMSEWPKEIQVREEIIAAPSVGRVRRP